jgi:hypothetical protein
MLARSPEDVATEALTLILGRSPAALGAMNRLLSEWCGSSMPSVVRWRSQVAGSDEARTDAEGKNADDQVVAILENKFWAGLTPNQPKTYLARLPQDRGVVAFVVPSARLEILTIEIAERVRVLDATAPFFRTMGKTRTSTLASGRTIVVTCWETVLAAMGRALEATQEHDALSDLRQLQGLCERMERGGFRPFTATDITGNAPALELQACALVDRSVERLLGRNIANKKGLKATAGKGWYGHYLWVHGFGCQLMFSAGRWAGHGISPIWLRVTSGAWKFPEGLGAPLSAIVADPSWIDEDRNSNWPGVWVPIRLLEGREEETVVDDMSRQLEAVADVLSKHPASGAAIEPPAVIGELQSSA